MGWVYEAAFGPQETSREGAGSTGGGTSVLPPSPPRWQDHGAGNICRPEVSGVGGVPDTGFPQEAREIIEESVWISFHPLGLRLSITSSRKWANVFPTPNPHPRSGGLPGYAFSLWPIRVCSDTSQDSPLDCQLPEGQAVVPEPDRVPGTRQAAHLTRTRRNDFWMAELPES